MSDALRGYLLYGSPLRTGRGRLTLLAIVVVVVVVAVLGYLQVPPTRLGGFISWLAFTGLGAVATFLIVLFLDGKRSVWFPLPWLQLIVLLSVTFVMAFVALFFNDKLNEALGGAGQLALVGFTEESTKILPVVLLAVFLPNVIRTRKETILYGALAAVGFNILETGAYIAKAIENGSPAFDAVMEQTTRFAALGFGNHVIWSMAVGLALGMSLESTRHGVRRWLPFVVGFVIIAVLHALYDLFFAGLLVPVSTVILELLSGNFDVGQIFDDYINGAMDVRNALIFEQYLFGLPIVLILIWQLFKSAKREVLAFQEGLADEQPPVMTDEQKERLDHEGRWIIRHYPGVPSKQNRALVKHQNWLAMTKQHAERRGDPIDATPEVQLLRDEIASLQPAPGDAGSMASA